MYKKFVFTYFVVLSSVILYCQSPIETRKITYACANKPLNIFLKEISKKSGINITFNETRMNFARKVTVNAYNLNLIGVLQSVLKPYRLVPEIVENSIAIVTQKEVNQYIDYTISGYIIDEKTNEPLPHTAAYLADGSVGVYSNEDGFYTIKLKRGNYFLKFQYTGYEEVSRNFLLRKDTAIDIRLKVKEYKPDEVEIKEDLNKRWFRKGEEFINQNKIQLTSSLAGEPDVIRSLNYLAGVTSGADGFGGQSIRGGNTDQNQIMLDGVPLQNTSHGFGLISIFNSDIVQDARLLKSYIPSKYSGRLSSVLDIKTKNGNNERLKGNFTISTITSKISLEGPISNNTTFMFSGRRTFSDIWIKSLTRFINQNSQNSSDGQTNYYFYDLTGKINIKLSRKTSISILGLYANDDYDGYRNERRTGSDKIKYVDQSSNKLIWGNVLGAITLDRQIGKNAFGKGIIYLSSWKTQAFTFSRNAIDSLNKVTDIYKAKYRYADFQTAGGRYDYSIQNNKKFITRLGFGGNYNSYSPALNAVDQRSGKLYPDTLTIKNLELSSIKKNNLSQELFIYGESEINFSSGANVTFGLHGSRYKIDSLDYMSLQPRVSLSLTNEYSWINASITKLQQHQQSLNEEGLGFPTNVWVSSTGRIKPANGTNYNVSFGFALGNTSSINTGGYYKTMNNIIAIGEGEELIVNGDDEDRWQANIPRGKGSAYGIELSYNYTSSRFNIEVNGTYGHSNRKFLDLNNGLEYPFNLDRRYYGNGIFILKLGKKTVFNLSATYGDGARLTAPIGSISVIDRNGVKLFGINYKEKNGYKLPNLFKADFGFTTIFGSQEKGHKLFLGVYNLTNRKSPIYLKIERNNFDLNEYSLKSVSLFTLIPAFSYSYIF